MLNTTGLKFDTIGLKLFGIIKIKLKELLRPTRCHEFKLIKLFQIIKVRLFINLINRLRYKMFH